MRDIVRRRAADAEIEGRVSGHSLRVGSAQSLREAGATMTDLMTAGRWNRVETMARYVRSQDAAFGPVARLRYGVLAPDHKGRKHPHLPRRRAKRAKARRELRWSKRRRFQRMVKKVEKRLARIERAVMVPEQRICGTYCNYLNIRILSFGNLDPAQCFLCPLVPREPMHLSSSPPPSSASVQQEKRQRRKAMAAGTHKHLGGSPASAT